MANGRIGGLGRAITLFQVGAVGGLTDGQLLERFASGRGEAGELAFAALVDRHGPMVSRVCRSILADPHEAQDAYQAAFLVLARKARSLWVDDSLGPWLHGVACRVAVRARSAAALRRSHERRHAEAAPAGAGERPPDDDVGAVLHEEVDRLPERFRVPVILCYLEGLTHEQAAARLRWPVGTVRSRLARGRERLRTRLVRRGLAPAVGMLGVLSAKDAIAARLAPGTVPARVAAWAGEEIRAMWLTKLKACLTALGIAAAGAGAFAVGAAAGQDRGPQAPVKAAAPGDAEKIRGKWTVVELRQVNHEATEDEKRLFKSGGFTILITADRIVYDIDKSEMRYTLDPSRAPREMTLERLDDRSRKAPAIYRLEGDDLMICQGRTGDAGPPRAFSVKDVRPDAPFPTLFILKRTSSLTEAAKKLKLMEARVSAAKAGVGLARANLAMAEAKLLAAEADLAAEAEQKRAEAERKRAEEVPPR